MVAPLQSKLINKTNSIDKFKCNTTKYLHCIWTIYTNEHKSSDIVLIYVQGKVVYSIISPRFDFKSDRRVNIFLLHVIILTLWGIGIRINHML